MSRQLGSIYNGTSRTSVDPSSGAQNRQVSLANIATAFLTERKSSSRRQSNGLRKKRLASKGQQVSITKRQSSYTTTADEILLNQRLSSGTMNDSITALFTQNNQIAITDNKLATGMENGAEMTTSSLSKKIVMRHSSFYVNGCHVHHGTSQIHLNIPAKQQTRRPSFDLSTISALLSPTRKKLDVNISTASSSSVDGHRSARLCSVSSSYAQFLKQRDMDKNKKVLSPEDHRLLLSSSEWVEDVRDTDPYVSVLSRLGEAIQDSETYFEFVKKSFSIITQTFLATVLLILLTVFQVILFFMGVKYLNDCPIQPNLPVYLLVVGSLGLVRVLNMLWKQFRRRRLRKLEGLELDQEEETENDGSDFTDIVLNLFLLVWFIVGQFWTWRVYKPNFDFGLDDPDKYCHRNVYTFILVHIGFVYVMFLATILFLFALTCCARFPHLIVKTPR